MTAIYIIPVQRSFHERIINFCNIPKMPIVTFQGLEWAYGLTPKNPAISNRLKPRGKETQNKKTGQVSGPDRLLTVSCDSTSVPFFISTFPKALWGIFQPQKSLRHYGFLIMLCSTATTTPPDPLWIIPWKCREHCMVDTQGMKLVYWFSNKS